MRGERRTESRAGRSGGNNKTLILVLVVVVAVLGIAALVVTSIQVGPEGHSVEHRVVCMDNLRQIGTLLAERYKVGTLRNYDGPAFLLQVAPDLTDEELAIFLCPGEPEGSAPGRPQVGSPEFIRMYRELTKEDLAGQRDWSLYTSYAGPNMRDYPVDRVWPEGRLWACDRCPDGTPHHAGLSILYATSEVDFLALEHVERTDGGKILVGPGSPDSRLEKLSLGASHDHR